MLKAYLDAWFPIMGKWNGRILFVDGFAGPGEYEGGEDGSPIIALRAYMAHPALPKIKAEVVFHFIEDDERRVAHLATLVEGYKPLLPENCTVSVIPGTFDESMTETFEYLEAQKTSMAPAFVMVDPFGVKGHSMSVIRGILQNRRCEVYISFMYEAINRFNRTTEFEGHLDALFGCPEWREGREIGDPDERKIFFYDLYEEQLRKAGAEQVIRFELYDGNRLVYSIFFATQDVTGSDRMKAAIWRADPTGNFRFRGAKSGQLDLGIDVANFEPLKQALLDEFTGRDWVAIETVLDFVSSDKTDYHRSQVKTKALRELEDAGLLEADENTRNRRRTYPDGTLIRFLSHK